MAILDERYVVHKTFIFCRFFKLDIHISYQPDFFVYFRSMVQIKKSLKNSLFYLFSLLPSFFSTSVLNEWIFFFERWKRINFFCFFNDIFIYSLNSDEVLRVIHWKWTEFKERFIQCYATLLRLKRLDLNDLFGGVLFFV